MDFIQKMNIPNCNGILILLSSRNCNMTSSRVMNADYPVDIDLNYYPLWESAIWMKAAQRENICTPTGEYRLIKGGKSNKGARIVANELRR